MTVHPSLRDPVSVSRLCPVHVRGFLMMNDEYRGHEVINDWCTARVAGTIAHCGRRTIYRAVEEGRLRAVRLGGRRRLRLRRAWIEEWLLAGGFRG